MACNHTDTERWFPNTGNLFDDSKDGHALLIKTPNGLVRSLVLCRDCGRTFASNSRDRKARTAATLRELEALADE